MVYTAHWDHFGIGEPVNGDKIYNGALDNASGVASLLEMARALTQVKPPPKRSILFLAVTAEEQGLLGSQYYAVTPLYPLAKTLANINMDGINQWGRTKDITVIGLGASDLDDYLRDAAAEQGRTLRPDPEAGEGLLLPLRSLQLRQAGRAGALHGHRRRVHRQAGRVRQAEARRIHRERLPPAVGPDEARLGSVRAPSRMRQLLSPSATASPTPTSSPSGSRGTSSRRSGMR